MNKTKVLKFVPFATTFLIMLMIFMFSAQTSEQSSNISRGLTAKIVDLLPFTGNWTDADKQQLVMGLHNFVRKCAHFTIYFLLGVSSSAMFASIMPNAKQRKLLLCCIIFCGAYAATDEFHQLFVSGRGGMLRDVLLDTCGGTAGGVSFVGIRNLLKRRR